MRIRDTSACITTLRAACLLSAFVCVTAQAQECSGGPAGGIDATGNQCNAGGKDADSALPAATRIRPVAESVTPTRTRVATSGSRLTGTTVPGPQFSAASRPASRFHASTILAAEPVHTAKIADASESTCSGGSAGGMDATGNQCNVADSAGGVVVAQDRGR
jgi:hypothetical protein